MQFAEELDEVNFQRGQPVPQLNDIKPSLATLHLAHQALVATEQLSQITLAKTLAFPRALELLQKNLVVTGVEDLGHVTVRRSR